MFRPKLSIIRLRPANQRLYYYTIFQPSIQVRKTKRKRNYYICENNPQSCDYISWNKPKLGEKWNPDDAKEIEEETKKAKRKSSKKTTKRTTRKRKIAKK